MNHRFKNHDAATLLGVDTRTVKRWMKQPALREALGAVRHGKQWRIPQPADIENWKSETRWRLKKEGIELLPEWKRALRKLAKKNERCRLEAIRLWLAALLKVLANGNITQADREAIYWLHAAAMEILASLPRYQMEADKLKDAFPARLSKRGLSEQELSVVMSYWPDAQHFEEVRAIRTRIDLEEMRRRLDHAQAVCQLEEMDQTPTQENIAPVLHNDLTAHLNDTAEELPGIVFRAQSTEQLHNIAVASAYNSLARHAPLVVTTESQKTIEDTCRRIAAAVTIDFRQPQKGLARRTVQKRYPRRETKKADAIIHGALDFIPGAEVTPQNEDDTETDA